MLLILSEDHKEHLSFLQKVDLTVVGEFGRIALEFLKRGTSPKIYEGASRKLCVPVEMVQHGVEGLMFLLTESSKYTVQSDDFLSSAPMIASMLDPRHKHLSFLTPTQRVTAIGKLLGLREDVGQVAIPQARGDEAAMSDTQNANTGAAATAPASAMALLLREQYTPRDTGIETEVQNFLRETPPSMDCKLTDWWKVNGARFPRLVKAASQYLCILATSVPSEQVFSAAGLTLTRLCSRLTLEHVDMLIFLNKNQ